MTFERLAALFELGAERSAIALVTASSLAALPTLAGELARRYALHPVDLTRDDDPYADLTSLPRGRVLVGLSLLSPTRMQQCLGQLNRGRDRIHALGLHVVLVIDDADLRLVHALAPDFASRVHELLHFELEHRKPRGALVLSPLGPVRRPDAAQAHPNESGWMRALGRLVTRVNIRDACDDLYASAASLAWRLATKTQTWVAWVDTGDWDTERVLRWLRELGGARLWVVLNRGGHPLPAVSMSTAYYFHCARDGESTPRAEQGWIDLCPPLRLVTPDVEPRHRREQHGNLVWLIHAREDAGPADELANALDMLGCGVLRADGDREQQWTAELSDAVVVLLSPAAMSSPTLDTALQLLAKNFPSGLWHRTIVLLDRVSAANARERVGRGPTLLTLRSPRDTAQDIVRRFVPAPPAGAGQVSTHRPADEMVIEPREDASPLSLANLRELRWYLIDYPRWPYGRQREHARTIEAELPAWGRALHAFVGSPDMHGFERVVVASDELALLDPPWELLSDAEGFLSTRGICVARRPPLFERRTAPAVNRAVLRVLLLLVRPREYPALDPRATVEALSGVLTSLELHVLARPSFAELTATLDSANARGQPFQIVHYDGYGTVDADGHTCLAFEGDGEGQVPVERLAWQLGDHRVDLCVLDLHWNGVGGVRLAPAYAVELLVAGVRRVIALDVPLRRPSHELFVGALYGAIAEGEKIDRALELARHALRERASVVQDWFVPMLFEADAEPLRLVTPTQALRREPAEPLDHPVPGRAEHGFRGRYSELLAIDELLRRERAVILHGAQGLGKTALAAECARWQLQMQRFHHVVWLGPQATAANLEVIDTLDELPRHCEVLVVIDTVDAWDKVIDTLDEILRHREVLVVLDALDTWSDTSVLERLAAYPNTRILGTSQVHPRTLGPDLHPLMLEGLDDEHGTDFLADLLLSQQGADDLEHDRSSLEELVQRVGGHPQTLLALAPVVVERGLQQAASQWLQLAVVPDVAALARLEPELQNVLSVFAAGGDMVTPPLIGHVLQRSEAEIKMIGERLVDRGVAYVRNVLLFIQPGIRAALLAQLDADTRTDLDGRWRGAYFWIIFAVSEGKLSTDLVRGLDHALVDAVEHAIDVGWLEAAQFEDVLGRLERTIRPIASPAARTRLDELLQRVDTWYARVEQVRRDLAQGMSSAALTGAEQLLAAIEASANDSGRRAEALFLLGRALYASNRYEDALDVLQQSRELYEGRGPYPVWVDWLIARILRSLGRLDEATESIERALEVSERASATFEIGRLAADLGEVRAMQGRLDEATAKLQQALKAFETSGHTKLAVAVKSRLGRVFVRAGRLDEAERVFLDLLEPAVQHGYSKQQFFVCFMLGLIYAATNRLVHAASQLEEAAQIGERSGVLADQLTALAKLSDVQRELGRTDAARQTWETAQQLYRAYRERGGQPLDAFEHS